MREERIRERERERERERCEKNNKSRLSAYIYML